MARWSGNLISPAGEFLARGHARARDRDHRDRRLHLRRAAPRRARRPTPIEASEARFRDVADASSDWIWEVDAALRLHLHLRALCAGDREAARDQSRHADRRSVPPRREPRPVAASISRRSRSTGAVPQRRVACARMPTASTGRSASPASRCSTRRARRSATAAPRPTSPPRSRPARRAQYLALHDPLTELPNRVLLHERLEQAIASVSRRGDMAALLLLDLDRFKDINDTLGPSRGRSAAQGGRACGSAPACARSTPSRGSAATSSAIVLVGHQGRRRAPSSSAGACSRPSGPRSILTATRSWLRSASASR